MNTLIEVCIDSSRSACIAQAAGAHRVELCTNIAEGGTTPSYGLIEAVRKLLTIKLFVLIRPRGGDFLYDDVEFEIMKSDIRRCGELGCDGVVIGMLNADGTIDVERCRELVRIAREQGLGVTFHRAFDRCADLLQGLEAVIGLGCERILTSGGRNTATEGTSVIQHLIDRANGRIIIMPGAGVTPENAAKLLKETGARELHGTFRTFYQSPMIYKNIEMSNGGQDGGFWLADATKINALRHM